MTPKPLSIHHLGIAVPDLGQARTFYLEVFGLLPVSPEVADPIQKVRICLLGNPQQQDCLLELICPWDTTSPVNGYLSKGIGAYHICYEVPDLDTTLKSFQAGGCLLVSPPVPAVAFGGRRIAWLRTPTRQLVELLEAQGNGSGSPGTGTRV